MGRHQLGKFLWAFAFSAALMLSTIVLGNGAAASPQWCEEDPTFVVNGALIDVTTQFSGQHINALRGPVQFELLVPSNSIAAVVSLPGTVPLTAKVTRSLPAYYGLLGVPVVVKVTVPATYSFSTQTRVIGTYTRLAQWVNGSSNTTTWVNYRLLGL